MAAVKYVICKRRVLPRIFAKTVVKINGVHVVSAWTDVEAKARTWPLPWDAHAVARRYGCEVHVKGAPSHNAGG